jgi:membrane-associated phospholipid phosphatase
MFAAHLLLNAAIRPAKKAINRTRPNGRGNSFPSAHTATAFVASEIIRQELRGNNVALQYSGYALAMSTAWLRLYRKKHWLSDVLAGALTGRFFGRLASRLIGK